MRSFGVTFVTTLLVSVGLALAGREAFAKPKIALEADFALPVSVNGAKPGAGGALRGGYDIDLALVHVMPEIGLGFHKLTDSAGPSVFRGFAGGRVGVGAGVRLDGFAHIGYGYLGTPAPPFGAVDSSYGAPILDAGLALDFTLIPVVDLGLHGSYNTALTQNGVADTPRWIGLGAHVAFAF